MDKDRIANQFKSPATLAQWLQGYVSEWQERDSQMMCLAFAGEAVADARDQHSMEAGVFRVVYDTLGDTSFSNEISAGIALLAEMAQKGWKRG